MHSYKVWRLLPGLLLLCLPGAAAPEGESDRAALLEGVTEIAAPGGLPGALAVFGDGAWVVVAGRAGRGRLPLMAAARFGRGRAVALGHEAFFGGAALARPDNALLALNVARWTGGRPVASLRAGLLGQDRSLSEALSTAGCRVVEVKPADLPAKLRELDELWMNQASLDGDANRERVEAVRQWVREGGGVVVSGPAWGWQSVHPGLDLLRDHGGNRLLAPMGLAFSTATLDPTGKQGFSTAGERLSFLHAGQALKALEAHAAGRQALGSADLEGATLVVAEAASAAPEDTAFARRVSELCADRGAAVPSREMPVTTAMPFARLKAVLDARTLRGLPAEKVTAHPAAASFPGPVPSDAKREARSVTVDTGVPGWHGTGLYAPPGERITVTLPPGAAGKGLALRIGPHTDRLWQLPRWERFPEVSRSWPLARATMTAASPFGGTAFIEVPDGCALGELSVTLAGAIAAPHYTRGRTRPEEWAQLRKAPAPWAELEGQRVILSVPSTAVRDLEDPEALMAYWDGVLERCCELYAAPRRARPERYCVDRQISAGYMHSGYPIMTGDDVARAFCDLNLLRGREGIRVWGFYHELGHNFQQPTWTWDGFGEVTNNLFSLYAEEKINGVTVGAHPAMTAAEMEKRVRAVAAEPGKEAYYRRDPWFPLTMFALLRQGFGWEPFTRVFAGFRDLPARERPGTDPQKRDQFLVRFSKATGRNLTGYLSAWGVETSPSAREAVVDLPSWMPADWPKP